MVNGTVVSAGVNAGVAGSRRDDTRRTKSLVMWSGGLDSTFALARLLERRSSPWQAGSPMARVLTRWPELGRVPLATALCVIYILVGATAFAELKQRGTMHLRSYSFWNERYAVQTLVDRRCQGCGILAFDDGIVSFSLESPTLNALGLTMDREASEAWRAGKLLDLAWERGHRLLVSVNYLMPPEAYQDPRALREYLLANQVVIFVVSVLYHSKQALRPGL